MASKHLQQLYWTDAHFCGLRAQTNVYGLTKITSKDGLTKLLAASINGYFISVEYQKSFNRLIPITREDVFFSTGCHLGTGHGGESEIFEIVSMDVMCASGSTESTILAISYLKLETHFVDKPPTSHLGIYVLPPKKTDVPNLNIRDAIAQSSIQNINLDFIPFKLMHEKIYREDGKWEMCFLLGGNDNKIHVFRQLLDGDCFYEEQRAAQIFFPEFAHIDGCVTQMEFRWIDDKQRLTALGYQRGLITLSLVNVISREAVQTWSTEMDSPITSLHLFTQYTNAPCPDFLDNQDYPHGENKELESSAINLLVTSAIDPSAVFCDVLSNGLSKSQTLPFSNSQDIVLCSCVIDIDFDGENEILIGTYGQVLLAYKFVYEQPQSMLMTSTPFQSPLPVGLTQMPTPLSDVDHSSRVDTSFDQDKSDHRRRHKSMAGLMDSSDGQSKLDKHDRHKSDELNALLDVSLRDNQMARLFRSQENLSTLSPRSVYFSTPDHLVPSELSLPNGGFADLTEYPCYRLTWNKRFSDPVMGLAFDDVMGDGMLDLIVLTLKGLHILQPDLNEVAQLVMERLKQIIDPGSEADDDYHQLQTEALGDAR